MRSIEFIKVTFNNYACYTEEMVYEFHNSKIQLVVGANGTGKSNLFNSIPVCLYGMTPDGRKGDDLVNNKVKKNCYIFLEFKIDADLYLMQRYIKHSKEGSTVLLFKNGELINKGHKEVLPVIESIFMPMRLFINLLYLTQKGEMFITLDDSKKKEIFEKMLDLGVYQTYVEHCDKKIKDVVAEMSSITSKINVCNEMITTFLDQLVNFENNRIKFNDKKTSDILELTERLSSLEVKKDQLKVKLPTVDKASEAMEITSKIATLQNKINSIQMKKKSDKQEVESKKQTKALEFKNRSADEKNKIQMATLQKKQELDTEWNEKVHGLKNDIVRLQTNYKNQKSNIAALTDRAKELEREIYKRESKLEIEVPTCSECGHELGENKDKILTIVAALQTEVLQTKNEILSVQLELDSISDDIARRNNDLTPIQAKYTDDRDAITAEENKAIDELTLRHQNGIRKLDALLIQKHAEIDLQFDNELKILEEDRIVLESQKRIVSLEVEEKRTIESEINNIDRTISGVKSTLAAREASVFDDQMQYKIIAEKDKNTTQLTTLTDLLSEREADLSNYEFWKVGFSMKGIPSILIEESVPFINERLSYYLDKIGGRFKVSFDVLSENKTGGIRDKISISIFDTVTHGDSHKQLSGGQARLIDIIIILTLRDLMQQYCGFSINIVLFDEIFDGLDEDNIVIIANLLRLLIGTQSYNIISHRHIDQIEYDEIYKTS